MQPTVAPRRSDPGFLKSLLPLHSRLSRTNAALLPRPSDQAPQPARAASMPEERTCPPRYLQGMRMAKIIGAIVNIALYPDDWVCQGSTPRRTILSGRHTILPKPTSRYVRGLPTGAPTSCSPSIFERTHYVRFSSITTRRLHWAWTTITGRPTRGAACAMCLRCRVAPELARGIAASLFAEEFDISFFCGRPVDHGCFSPLSMLADPDGSWPVEGTAAPSRRAAISVLSGPARCYRLGGALEAARSALFPKTSEW